MRQLIGVAAAVLVASAASAAEPEKAVEPQKAVEPEKAGEPAGAGGVGETAPAAPPARKKAKARIAVLDVRTGALDPKTFEGLSGLIASELAARAPAVQVIGSGDIRAMVGFEREKQLMGCSESSCLAEIGGALGVEYMLTTDCGKTGGTWLINMVLIDVGRARPLKRLSQRTSDENKLVDEAVAGVQQMVAELPGDGSAPAPQPVAKVEARPAEGGRNKLVTWGLVLGGVVGIAVGSVAAGMGWETHRQVLSDQKDHVGTGVSRYEAQQANNKAIAGYVVGAVGIAAATWGALRLILPESPAQVSVVPTSGGVHAAVSLELP